MPQRKNRFVHQRARAAPINFNMPRPQYQRDMRVTVMAQSVASGCLIK